MLPPFDDIDGLPPWPKSLLEGIRARNDASTFSIVILDDDPLGGQCVHDIPVLTKWDTDLLVEEMERSPAFLLLTNTRSLSRPDAIKRSRDIGHSLRQAALEAGGPPAVVWRSDSTLRGHFWWEMDAFVDEFSLDGMPEPVYVYLPYFGEVGRLTRDDTQYLLQQDMSVPVAETEFARDPAYAFDQSHLPSWLEAHSEGNLIADDVVCISLKDLRDGGADKVADILRTAPKRGAVVVNAIIDRDIEVFVSALQEVENVDRRFLCSGAAPFVRMRLGQEARLRLAASELGLVKGGGGLTIVGSYIDKTSAQLAVALEDPEVVGIEMAVEALTEPSSRAEELARVLDDVAGNLAAGRDVVLHTSRPYVPGAAGPIDAALAEVVGALEVRPRYLLVKGGSTASALATGVLNVRRAMVLGQLLTGVPVWRLGDESRWPGLPFVIFAGNVGTEESLAEALRLLREG